jgi:hypothetical protein
MRKQTLLIRAERSHAHYFMGTTAYKTIKTSIRTSAGEDIFIPNGLKMGITPFPGEEGFPGPAVR